MKQEIDLTMVGIAIVVLAILYTRRAQAEGLRPISKGQVTSEAERVRVAIKLGDTNENRLTDTIFFERYPDRERRKITRNDPQYTLLANEWRDIRDTIVRPALRGV